MSTTSTMIANAKEFLPAAADLINVVASLIAVYLTGMAVVKAIAYSKQRGEGAVRPATPILMLLSGVMLWNLSASATAFLQTIYGADTTTQNLIGYTASASMTPQGTEMLTVLIMAVRLIGWFFMVLGWMDVTKIGAGKSSSEDAFQRSMWRIGGGVAAINIVGTVNLISGFLGFGDVL
ncbi:hypothetical protein ACW0US_17885 [Xanthomonas euvesicatoria]